MHRKFIKMKDNWIYKTCKMSLGTKKMADFMYALVMTSAEIHGTFGIGVKEYSRAQNCRNLVDVMIFINPEKVTQFELNTGVTLKEPQRVHIN